MRSEEQNYTRVNRSEDAAEAFYTRLAPIYDFLAASEKKFVRMGLQLLDPQPGENILEIGFGTGYAQGLITAAVREGFSAGLDLSQGMARIALEKLRQSDHAGKAGLVCSNTLPIPFPTAYFEGVFSSFTLELFDSPQIPEVLQECRRVLKPGGRLVIVSLSKDQPLGLMGRIYEEFHIRYPKIADCRPIPVKSLVENAGFTILETRENKMWGLPVMILVASDNYFSSLP
ncbi:MAG: methyltransferase domain-containing protein [Anaerolineales bacterium]|nr:methyltransferase domain-containing protein [Anaerolineales bacterium]